MQGAAACKPRRETRGNQHCQHLTMDSGLHICEKIHAGWSGAPVLSVVLSCDSRG